MPEQYTPPSMPLVEEEKARARRNQLVAFWKERHAMLGRQLGMMESGEMHTGTNVLDSMTQLDIGRVRAWMAELDELIAEHSK